MPAYTLSTIVWTQVTALNTRYSIRKPDARRIAFLEQQTQPLATATGIDLPMGPVSMFEPADLLWLKVSDGYGPVLVEVDQASTSGAAS